MGMNIKNEETHRLVRELTELTGESQTAAITQAVRERLQRVRQQQGGPSERLRKMMEIARDCAARMTDEEKATDIDKLLYDENGLPK
jgi:antitoxin VapB